MNTLIIFSIMFALMFSTVDALALASHNNPGQASCFATLERLTSSGITTSYNLPPFLPHITNSESIHILYTRQFATSVKNYNITGFDPDNMKNIISVTVNPYYLFPDNGCMPLGNIKFCGNMQHNRIPIALLGAGLIGLPFFRRLKKCMNDETRDL